MLQPLLMAMSGAIGKGIACHERISLLSPSSNLGGVCRALPVWLGLGALHLGLGLALKLYFFQYWSS